MNMNIENKNAFYACVLVLSMWILMYVISQLTFVN
jgi:hypothetical protein